MNIKSALVLATLLLGLAAGVAYANDADLITKETSLRVMGVAMGAVLIYYGNVIPKTLTPLSATRCDPAKAQWYQRIAGRAFVLGGFGYVISWVLLPIGVANVAAMLSCAASVVFVIGLCVVVRRNPRSLAES